MATSAILATASGALAQDFAQSFDVVGTDGGAGPSALLAEGFEFRRVIDPGLTSEPWRQGPWFAGAPTPWEGRGYLFGSVPIPPFAAGNVAVWIILPPVDGQTASSVASCWVRGMPTGEFPLAGRVELRRAPNGGTSTGQGTSSVGDFTELVAANSNAILSTWDHLQGNVGGPGRLAIRWTGYGPFSFSGTTLTLLVDDLTVSGDGATPPLPQPGQTVHWTTSMSPIHLTNQQIIPAGGTLVIDAGVEVWFDFNSEPFAGAEMMAVGGIIVLQGTEQEPVRLRRGIDTPNIPVIAVGSGSLTTLGTPARLEAHHVDSTITIRAAQSASLVATDSSFHRTQPIDWASLTDATWQTPTVQAIGTTARIERCTFRNAIVDLDDALAVVAGCAFDDGRLAVTRFPMSQSHAIVGNSFINSPRAAPIVLDGYGYLVTDNDIVGSLWPLSLNGAGLTPDSSVPSIGNLGNRIPFGGALGSEIVGPVRLPPMSVPYLIRTQLTGGDQYDATVTFEPGTTVEMGPDAGILFEGVARTEVRGTPEQPVRFRAEVAGQPWTSLSTASTPPVTIRNADLSGARWALGGVDTLFFVHDCRLSGNQIGVQAGDLCGVVVSKTNFTDNGVGCLAPWAGSTGIEQGRFFDLGPDNPNSFEGPGLGATTEPPTSAFSAMRYAWWGAPSGPRHPTNPGGSGAVAGDWVHVTPFRTTPVDFDDHPPVVDMMPVSKRQLLAGDRIILHWSARDDGSIRSQRLEFRPNVGLEDGVVAVDDIPAGARSLEFLIPDTRTGDPVLGADLGRAVFRLVAVDDRGQEGWDDVNWTLAPPAGGDIRFTGDFSPIRRVGENFDVPVSLDAILEYRLHLDDITDDVQLLGSSALSQGAGGLAAGSNRMPAVSSDLARYVVVVAGREHYSPYFTIRPKPELGDAPPMVQMLAPRPGSTHAGGSIVTIRWTADDTEGLRDFDIQASYDAGRTWHMVTKGLPPGTRSHAWQLPRSAGIPDVRLRVIARDTRFQVTSSGADHAFTIGPGDWTTACRADLNADGVVDGADLGAMLSGWGDPAAADITGDGNVDGADLGALLAVWGSCPT